MSTVNPLLDFVEVPAEQVVDEKSVIAEAKAKLAAQNEAKVKDQIRNLAHETSLFTDDGKFGKLALEQQQSLLAAVMDFLEEETEEAIRDYQQSDFKDGIDWDDSNVKIRTGHLVNAAKRNVFLPDWKKRIAKIDGALRYYPGRYNRRVVGFEKDHIQEVAAQIDQLSGEIPTGLTGNGLEFAPSTVGSGRKVYLDGQFVISLSGASFGSNPTNGDVVAWMTSRRIDFCNSRGAQTMWEIHAWKKGDKEPRRVFEDHAYTTERSLSLGAPNVDADGTIVFSHFVDGSTTMERVTL